MDTKKNITNTHTWDSGSLKFGNTETRKRNKRNIGVCQIQESGVSVSYSSKCEICNTETDKISKIEEKHGSGCSNTHGSETYANGLESKM